jgi:hypothetical protein
MRAIRILVYAAALLSALVGVGAIRLQVAADCGFGSQGPCASPDYFSESAIPLFWLPMALAVALGLLALFGLRTRDAEHTDDPRKTLHTGAGAGLTPDVSSNAISSFKSSLPISPAKDTSQ